MAIERTLVLVKPDGMKRRLSGLAVDRLDNSGFEMVAAKMVSVTEELARKHYALLEGQGVFKDKTKYDQLINFIKGDFHGVSGRRVLAMVYRGENAVKGVARWWAPPTRKTRPLTRYAGRSAGSPANTAISRTWSTPPATWKKLNARSASGSNPKK